uniref:Uncharacterized protein n=1 Tax=Vespula pensylvanica TaxID=30213 RepID=A0A834UB22_VESPE|nr:hypothetical protein H0235_006928 [Vespula pensylvanica]
MSVVLHSTLNTNAPPGKKEDDELNVKRTREASNSSSRPPTNNSPWRMPSSSYDPFRNSSVLRGHPEPVETSIERCHKRTYIVPPKRDEASTFSILIPKLEAGVLC